MNTNNDTVLLEVDEQGIATVTLNNPEKHNAFDDGIIKQLTDIFNDISNRDDVNIMILASNGKSFSAGADLGWMKRMASYSSVDNLMDANALGAAFGGAVGLASCCDIVIASTKASFCLSEVKLGLIPATISPYVVDAIGLKASRRYFQTAERFFSDKAQLLGLVDEVVAPELLADEVNSMVAKLLANGSQARRQAKKLSQDVAFQTIDDNLLKDTSERIAAIRVSTEGQEGLTAFFEKRTPNW